MTMSRREIPVNAWTAELDGFSRQHEGWIVTVRVVGEDGTSRIAARDLPLRGVSAADPGRHDVVVMVGEKGHHVAHQIPRATSVAIDETSDGVQQALIIGTRDGTTTIEFRSPMRPEEVDGLPDYER
jgi:Family of unknown function (DUF5335)